MTPSDIAHVAFLLSAALGCSREGLHVAAGSTIGVAGEYVWSRDPCPVRDRARLLCDAAMRAACSAWAHERVRSVRAVEDTIRRVLEDECSSRCMNDAQDREVTIAALTRALTGKP